MRLIYQNGQQVGHSPVGHYVYLWRAGENARYVGKAIANQNHQRWKDQLKSDRNDDNQRKMRYFRRFGNVMSCFIIAEGLVTEAELAERETMEINQRGITVTGTGPLLNARGGSAFYEPRAAWGERKAPVSRHHTDWVAQPDFAFDATIRYINPNNAWGLLGRGPNGRGYQFHVKVLTRRPSTVQQAIDFGEEVGLKPREVQEHLRWLYTWTGSAHGPFIEIDGKIFKQGKQ
jgi:hypothetical protein